MKKKLFFAAVALVALASCSDNEFIGDNSPTTQQENAADEIQFGLNVQNTTRAGELVGATAAEKLGGMFVVEGTKGSEQENSPSTTVVFDNYLVGYTANTAGTTESNTRNWEYVGLHSGITGKLEGTTWTALHPSGANQVTAQSVKYWDYSQDQYDFIAWSTGTCEAITGTAEAGKVKVTRINTGTTLKTNGFSMTAVNADNLKQCYYTDITKVLKANYGAPVTLTFRNMAAKVRVAFYETVPGYSVKNIEFYQDETTTLTTSISSNPATLYTTGSDVLPQSGTVTVIYPRIGTTSRDDSPQPEDYNKASVSVSPGSSTSTKQTFSTLPASAIGETLPTATFAGAAADDYYQAVIPNTDGKVLTLRVNYTLESTDGSGENIKIYGAKAVVPSTYTKWLPNYAYTYIFKISDNSNGWTNTDMTKQGLIPITFDAVVTSFVDANAEQTTVTTVATPSITTYQQNHNTGTDGAFTVPNEYDNDGAKLYVRVMNGSTPITGLSSTNSLFFRVETTGTTISEATVMDALQNRTNNKDAADPAGRNGITLTAQTQGSTGVINNTATSIVNGVDNQPITGFTSGDLAEINLANLTGTFAYVYVSTAPTADEAIYHVAAGVTSAETAANYYEVKATDIATTACAANAKAAAGKVYFVKNVDETGALVSWTFKQTKVNDDVEGLYEASIPSSKGTSSYNASYFYFDVYNQNNGAYAVKVIKVED